MKTCEIIEKILSAVFRAMICACIILLLYMISFRANNFIKNNITRSLNIFGINKTDFSYCLLSNILALLSKNHFQSKTFICI